MLSVFFENVVKKRTEVLRNIHATVHIQVTRPSETISFQD